MFSNGILKQFVRRWTSAFVKMFTLWGRTGQDKRHEGGEGDDDVQIRAQGLRLGFRVRVRVMHGLRLGFRVRVRVMHGLRLGLGFVVYIILTIT